MDRARGVIVHRPKSVLLAQVQYILVGVLAALGLIAWFVMGPMDSNPSYFAARFWAGTAFLLVVAVCSMYVAIQIDGEGSRPRRAWWVGIVVGVLVAVGGAVIIHSPVRTGQDDLIPELFWGTAVLVVAGTLLATLLVPRSRRWARDETEVDYTVARAVPPPPSHREDRNPLPTAKNSRGGGGEGI